ncbi:hypothetical protein J4G48_0028390 [Bradyrhizobium barranii subsp. apii]|uniref:hypothetical protein n=1 Tax=Bradyrhizobium barranii TaxID=2992140 RepID=UPI001AA0F555|nr:hypothetical protein [Bradyrhizobium barranii]UPT93291.1 hypothetical protein J4G48_0028390 [Bradyrhizobium barranii subsp. apii]
MIATGSQDRHRQFSSLCEQRFVVLAVLNEGSKLSAKGIVDGTRTSIERRIVIPWSFADRSGGMGSRPGSKTDTVIEASRRTVPMLALALPEAAGTRANEKYRSVLL